MADELRSTGNSTNTHDQSHGDASSASPPQAKSNADSEMPSASPAPIFRYRRGLVRQDENVLSEMFAPEEVPDTRVAHERVAAAVTAHAVPAVDTPSGGLAEALPAALPPRFRTRLHHPVTKAAPARRVNSDAIKTAVARTLAGTKVQLRSFNQGVQRFVEKRPRHVKQWAVPVLVLVVLVESAWLATGFLRDDDSETPVAGVALAPTPPQSASVAAAAAVPPAAIEPTPAQGTTGIRPTVTPLKPAPAPGSVTITTPFQVEVYESGRFVGVNSAKGIPLSAGSHTLEFVNDSLQYRASHKVAVTSGRNTQIAPVLPTGTLNLNATPWAEVFVDGDSVGETPLGNVQVPIGPRTIVFRHPQLGEQTRRLLITAGSTQRLGVDLRK
jgi:hypothetical protein